MKQSKLIIVNYNNYFKYRCQQTC